MILSHKHRYVFIKSSKTAGTSVELYLSRYCGDRDVITPLMREEEEAWRGPLGGRGPQNVTRPFAIEAGPLVVRLPVSLGRIYVPHHTAAKVRITLPPKIWDSYFKFTIVRNPYDRAVSRYFWFASDNYWVEQATMDGSVEDINRYVIQSTGAGLTNWKFYADAKNRLLIDRAIRYETLVPDLTEVVKRLGVAETVDLPRAKAKYRSNREHYSRILGSEARARIEQCAHWELETFGYRWENA